MNMTAFKTLIKREYWEHRAFINVPLVLAGVMIFIFLTEIVTAQNFIWDYSSGHVSFGNASFYNVLGLSHLNDLRQEIWNLMFIVVMLPMVIALSLMVFFYALSSLYDERRDRSILFWKSMPVSDAGTVLSKVFSAFITAPLITATIAILVQIIILLLFSLWAFFHGENILPIVWSPYLLLSVFAYDLFTLIMSLLWLAPVLGWLWFVASFVKKSPFLIAVFVPLGWMLVELMLFHSHYLADALANRWSGFWQLGATAIQKGNMATVFYESQFWWGLLVCGIFVLVSIYIRRFKDDSY